MKKHYITLFAALLVGATAFGQAKRQSGIFTQAPERLSAAQHAGTKTVSAKSTWTNYAKTTAVTIYSEDFGSGTPNSLPAGWDVSSAVNTNWVWMNTAPTGFFTRGIINSTTASNGYMIFRADSIFDALPNVSQDGILTSPVYDFSAHANVGLEFEQWYTNFQDSCFVEVNNADGNGWYEFPVFPNNLLEPNEALSVNPTIAKINISEVAGNQSAVQIRFHYRGRQGGAYSWLIDDVRFTELDSVDVGVSRTAAVMSYGNFVGPVGIIPIQFADTVWPGVLVANYGNKTGGVVINNTIYNGSAQVYSKNQPLDTLAVNLYGGQLIQNDSFGFVPTEPGRYTITSAVSAAGDVITANDVDSATFFVSDSSWSTESGRYLPGGFWLHYPAQLGNPERSSSIGTSLVTVPGMSDTLTSVSAAFRFNTKVGTRVQCHIYRFISSWKYVASTEEITLTANDLSTASQAKFVTFPLNIINTGGYIMVEDDGSDNTNTTWAAVLQAVDAQPTDTVRVLATEAPGFGIFGDSGGLSDTSTNSGLSSDFAPGTALPSSLSNAAPAIRMNFGNGAESILSVNNVSKNNIAASHYPNPANKDLNISFSLATSANVVVTVINAIGQTVKIQNIGYVAARQQKAAKINTADLPAGMYLYSIVAEGQKVTKRFIVTR